MILSPALGRRYWVNLCLASALGANLGDVLSRVLGLGYWRGLPVVAVLLICVAWGARAAPRFTAWYWLAIVFVRVAATNLSDLQILNPGEPPTVRSPLAFPIVIAVWAVALVCLALWDRSQSKDAPRTATGLWFWTTMLVAATLGTATGDWLAYKSGLDLPVATILSGITLVVALFALSGRADRSAIAFWLIVFFVRTWTTNVGDWLADGIGLWQSTAIAATLTFLMLYFWRPQSATRATTTG